MSRNFNSWTSKRSPSLQFVLMLLSAFFYFLFRHLFVREWMILQPISLVYLNGARRSYKCLAFLPASLASLYCLSWKKIGKRHVTITVLLEENWKETCNYHSIMWFYMTYWMSVTTRSLFLFVCYYETFQNDGSFQISMWWPTVWNGIEDFWWLSYSKCCCWSVRFQNKKVVRKYLSL